MTVLRLAAFLLGSQLGLMLYVMSSFLNASTHSESAALFYFLAYLGTLYVQLNLHHLVARYGKAKMELIFSWFTICCFLIIGIWGELLAAVVPAVLVLMIVPLVWTVWDMLLEDNSRNKVTGSIRGINLTILNLGVFFGPLISGWLMRFFGFRAVFLVCAFLTFVVFLLIRFKFKTKHANYAAKDLLLKDVWRELKNRPDVVRIYAIAVLLYLFYTVMNIYTPIILLDQGFGWDKIGGIFAVMLIPFVVIQYPLGKIADKKTGEKEWLFAGIILIVGATSLLIFGEGRDALWWALLLLLGRIGAAVVEVMRDSYFFKQITSRDVGLIGFFRTAESVAAIFGTAFFGLIVLVLQGVNIYPALAATMSLGIFFLLRLKDTK